MAQMFPSPLRIIRNPKGLSRTSQKNQKKTSGRCALRDAYVGGIFNEIYIGRSDSSKLEPPRSAVLREEK